MHPQQRTLASSVGWTGTGLHTGAPVRLVASPAEPDSGIVFCRSDLPGSGRHRLGPRAAMESSRCTRLQWGDVSVLTPEHFLSACAGLGLTNLHVELDGPEVPILDGSAAPFVQSLLQAGPVSQGREWPVLRLSEALLVQDGAALVLVRPAESFSITYVASYPHPLVGTQVIEYSLATDYATDLAPARTFGFWEEVEALQKQGLIVGGSLDCAVLVMPDGFSSPLRYPDELGRHKVLDLLGDLASLGCGLAAHVVAVRFSHRLHARLLQALAGLMENSPVQGERELAANLDSLNPVHLDALSLAPNRSADIGKGSQSSDLARRTS